MSCRCKEQWKEIKGFKNYFISSKGRVLSHKRGYNYIFIKCFWNKKDKQGGYLFVGLRNPKKHPKNIHRLVIEHFGNPQPENTECDHLDMNRSNNCICNLRWVSKSINQLNKKVKGRIIKIERKSGLRYKFLYQIKNREKNKTFKNIEGALIAQKIFQGAYNILTQYE